jgi:hypothetical protein
MVEVTALMAMLSRRLTEQKKRAKVSVKVGFNANYAIWVHEKTWLKFKVGKAKFLEDPARQNREKYAKIVRKALKTGMALADALKLGGLALQADAQKECPVRTGFLRASAFTEIVL